MFADDTNTNLTLSAKTLTELKLASKPNEPNVRGMRAERASHASHASHATQTCDACEARTTPNINANH